MTPEKHIVKILSIEPVTHNVRQYRIEKPVGYHFVPGQATEVSINKKGWEHERRPFTFTCLNTDPYLEFTIKSYTDHEGVTNELGKLKAGDELIIRDVWGAIEYKGEGYFIAGGAGITPFIAILRQLKASKKLGDNVLIFSNKTSKDVILQDELKEMLGDKAIFMITDDDAPGYEHGYIDKAYLQNTIADPSRHFYVCGPDKMISDIRTILEDMGAKPDAVVFEK